MLGGPLQAGSILIYKYFPRAQALHSHRAISCAFPRPENFSDVWVGLCMELFLIFAGCVGVLILFKVFVEAFRATLPDKNE